jgi:hypothetical protein
MASANDVRRLALAARKYRAIVMGCAWGRLLSGKANNAGPDRAQKVAPEVDRLKKASHNSISLLLTSLEQCKEAL